MHALTCTPVANVLCACAAAGAQRWCRSGASTPCKKHVSSTRRTTRARVVTFSSNNAHSHAHTNSKIALLNRFPTLYIMFAAAGAQRWCRSAAYRRCTKGVPHRVAPPRRRHARLDRGHADPCRRRAELAAAAAAAGTAGRRAAAAGGVAPARCSAFC